jgi:putative hemolysin
MASPLTVRRIREQVPLGFIDRLPHVQGTLDRLVGAGLGLDALHAYLEPLRDLRGQAFIDGAIDALGVTIEIADEDLARIPSGGRCVIAANHPTGILEMAMGVVLGRIRSDYRVVLNAMLLEVAANAEDLTIPVPIFRASHPEERERTRARIQSALGADRALLFFPSGVISSLTPRGRVEDGPWRPGFVLHALQAAAPVVPVYIDARNSRLFHALRAFGPTGETLSLLFLFREYLGKRGTTFRVRVGRPLTVDALAGSGPLAGERARAVASEIRARAYALADAA